MKPIFLSLGSEYSPAIRQGQAAAWQALDPVQVKERLQTALLHMFPEHRSQAYTLQGRDSIELALRALGVGSGDEVLTQAFSCHAVPKAIERCGATPVFVDIDAETLNPTVETLLEGLQRAPRARALIIQHTLGLPADSTAIREWCTHHNLFLIEDLAQGFGGVAPDGTYLGSSADAIVLSFGKNKILDATGGGACLLRPLKVASPGVLAPYAELSEGIPPFVQRTYPQVTTLARTAYAWGVGAPFVKAVRTLGFLPSPVKELTSVSRKCPVLLAAWAVVQLEQLPHQLAHRRYIAGLYTAAFSGAYGGSEEQYARGSCLRFVLRATAPQRLIAAAKAQQIFLADRWYREPVDSGSLHYTYRYTAGLCPVAERMAETTLNLPTHHFVTDHDVERIHVVAQKVTI